jgi:hypothetical protein
MRSPDHRQSAQLFTAAKRIKQVTDATQQSAMRAEDALTALEDREARRSVRDAHRDPRMHSSI